MYIWILLATIMVALSFFNLSPRPDKDNSINELKAATVVNRFRAEHTAVSKYMECEIVKQTNNSNWDAVPGGRISENNPVPVEVTFSGNEDDYEVSVEPNLAYTQIKCYLPIGYRYSGSLDVKHFIYCLDDKVEADGDRNYVACDKTRNRYLVSYVKIPKRWLSKDNMVGNTYRTPTPLFMRFLSKVTSAGSTYGWTDCFNGTCVLRGYSSKSGKQSRDENNVQVYEYTLLSDKSIFLNGESMVFNDCKSNPCLFAYTHFPVSDVANYCYNLMKKDNNMCVSGSVGSDPDGGNNEPEPENEPDNNNEIEPDVNGGENIGD